ncbi:hypothetical protein J5N97_008272 [Dioscorea zingiberensis]|uniref:Secreted protein n=1 Tax=Dioscorea zingiberensis TaxID=325984 RepID=A0A9D5DDI6_9LILI|nr:hypothetical protein J5N97_008272 [Dioscorea zingiberensis]
MQVFILWFPAVIMILLVSCDYNTIGELLVVHSHQPYLGVHGSITRLASPVRPHIIPIFKVSISPPMINLQKSI